MERFLRFALGFFALSTALGVLLRAAMVWPVPHLEFAHALHAHSHTLYFGWGALAVLTLAFELLGDDGPATRRLLWCVVGLSAATFAAFLHSGYGRPGIAVSALSLPVWAVAVVRFLRLAWRRPGAPSVFLRVAAVYLSLACVAALSRVVVLVLKPADPLWGRLAVYGFLDAFAAFMLLGSMGLLVEALRKRGVVLDRRLLRLTLGWLAPLIALTFPMAVPGAMDTPLGALATVAGAGLVVPAVTWSLALWRAVVDVERPSRWVLRSLAVAFLAKTVIEAAGAVGLWRLVLHSRDAVVLELHLVLLGLVSATLFWLIAERLRVSASRVLLLHQLALITMLVGLGLAALPALGAPVDSNLFGRVLALVGGALTWLVDANFTHKMVRSDSAMTRP